MRTVLHQQNPTTIREVVRKLDITAMTLDAWRRGSRRRPPLPVRMQPYGGHRRITIEASDLVAWLKQNRSDLVQKWQT